MDSKVKKYAAIAIAGIIVVIVASVLLRGCDQTITKRWGGATSIELKQDEKLEMVTWKDDQLWLQVRTDPKTVEFREHSRYGMLEGKVVVKEK
jgi:hypothetical protein